MVQMLKCVGMVVLFLAPVVGHGSTQLLFDCNVSYNDNKACDCGDDKVGKCMAGKRGGGSCIECQ
jgi:hypothetical protein